MNEYPKISIIVGCYNVAKWLIQGRLNDIYNQTYSNWELILVDDGSTDNTLELIQIEEKKDSRIKVIHKNNGGLGSARNAGLYIATGKYIWSFDVDDHVEPNCLEYCVKEAERRNVEILMFSYYAVTQEECTTEEIKLEETTINSNKELRDLYLNRILFIPNGNGFFWNKFYRRSFIEKYNLRFENQRIQQDEIFNLNSYKYLEKCYISPRILYHYYIYSKGNNRKKFIPDRFDIYKSVRTHFEELKTFWEIKDERFDDYLNKRFYFSVLGCINFNLFHPDCPWSNEEKRKEINRIMNDPYTKESIAYANRQLNSIENKIYLIAIKNRNLFVINTVSNLFKILHQIRKKLK